MYCEVCRGFKKHTCICWCCINKNEGCFCNLIRVNRGVHKSFNEDDANVGIGHCESFNEDWIIKIKYDKRR